MTLCGDGESERVSRGEGRSKGFVHLWVDLGLGEIFEVRMSEGGEIGPVFVKFILGIVVIDLVAAPDIVLLLSFTTFVDLT